jgi:gas vesicle protein
MMQNRNRNRNTFVDDTNYFFGFDGTRNDAPVIVTEDREVVPMENPYFLAESQRLGLFQNFDNNFDNAGGKLKEKLKNVGNKVSTAVKDTIQNPKKAIQNLGKDIKKGAEKVKEKAKDVAQDVGKGAKKIGLAVPRQAFLGLLAVNLNGLATRFKNKTQEGKNQVLDAWENKWGGDRGSLEGSANTGAKKKPIFISKKRMARIMGKQSASFDGQFENLDPATATLIIGAASVLVSLIPILKKAPSQDPTIDAGIDAGEENEERKDGQITPEEKQLIDQQIENQKNEIKNNPNLSQDEKDEMLKAFEGVGSDDSIFSKYKWYFIGGGILLLAIGGYFLYKNKNN